MNWRNNASHYGWVSVGLHWVMLLLLAAVYATMELEDIVREGSAAHASMEQWHYMLGLSVLVLVAVRLAVRLIGPTPALAPGTPAWQRLAAKLVHAALYFFMFAMPFLGWAILSAEGEAIPFFGWELPALLGPDEAMEEWLEEIHEAGATLGYLLIGLHAAAALYHHYFLHDDTLRRILPERRQGRETT